MASPRVWIDVDVKVDKSVPARWTMTSQGMVRRNHRLKMRNAKRFAIALAPVRTGRLKRSFTDRWISSTPTTVVHRLSNTAPYAEYVFKATAGARARRKPLPVGKSQITRRRGKTLPTAAFAPTGNVRLRQKVKGYRANPAMRAAIHLAFIEQLGV